MVIRLIINARIQQKLANKIPPLFEQEIRECFENRSYTTLKDPRRKHKTKPSTRWFIAQTNNLRTLKVIFIPSADGAYIIKTAYEPDKYEEKIYEENAGPIF